MENVAATDHSIGITLMKPYLCRAVRNWTIILSASAFCNIQRQGLAATVCQELQARGTTLCTYGNLLDQRYGTDALVHDFEELSFYLPTVHSVSTSIVSFQSTVHSGSVYLYSILLLRVLPVTALLIRISPNSRQTVYTYLLDFLD